MLESRAAAGKAGARKPPEEEDDGERGGAGIWSRQLSSHIHVAVTGARTWQANGMDGRGKASKCGIGQRQRKADDRGSGRILLQSFCSLTHSRMVEAQEAS